MITRNGSERKVHGGGGGAPAGYGGSFDRIAPLKAGRIVEMGQYDQLMAAESIFYGSHRHLRQQ